MTIPERYRLAYPWLTPELWDAVYELSVVTGHRYDDIFHAMEALRRPSLPTWDALDALLRSSRDEAL